MEEMNVIYGLGAGILWALETVLLSIILSKDTFMETKQIIFLAPFVSAFLNDALSSIWLFIFRKAKKQYRKTSVFEALKKRNGKLLLLSGLFGGPLGMSCYLLAIKYIGASNTAVISALYPAIGAILAWIFLKDKLSRKQLIGICVCTFGVIGMVGTPNNEMINRNYIVFAFACALFWSLEAVISSYAMKKGEVSFETALQIRHGTSIFCYVVLFLPLLHAWGFTIHVITQKSILLLLVTALIETASYLFYYKAISLTGAAKAMSLNITYMVWSVIFGIFLLKEVPQKYEMISIGVLLIGVLLVVQNVKENEKE